MNEEAKTPSKNILYGFIDDLRAGGLIRVDHPASNSTACIGDPKILNEIAYAVEKHMRQRMEG